MSDTESTHVSDATKPRTQTSRKAFILKNIVERTEQKEDGKIIKKYTATFGCPICLQEFKPTSNSPNNFKINKSSFCTAHEKKCPGPPPTPTTTTTTTTSADPIPPPATSTLNAIVGATHALSTHVPNAPSTTTTATAAEVIHLATRHIRTLETDCARLREQNARLTAKLEETTSTESMRATLTSATTSLETEKRKVATEHARVCAALKSEAATTSADASAKLTADLETQRSLYASLQSATKALQDELAANLAIAKAWLPSITGAKKLLDAATLLKEHSPHRPEFEASMNGWSNANARGIIMNLYDACIVNADTHFKTTPAEEAATAIDTAASSTENNLTTYNAVTSTITSTAHPSIAPTTTLETQGVAQKAALKSAINKEKKHDVEVCGSSKQIAGKIAGKRLRAETPTNKAMVGQDFLYEQKVSFRETYPHPHPHKTRQQTARGGP